MCCAAITAFLRHECSAPSGMELTQIELRGILIREPVTSLTDFIAALVSFYAFYRLHRLGRSAPGHRYFKLYFLLVGLALTASALLGHAFVYLFGTEWKVLGWTFGGLGIFCIQRSAVHIARPWIPSRLFAWCVWGTGLQLLLFLSLTTWGLMGEFDAERGFKFVQINLALGMAGLVLPLHVWVFLRRSNRGSLKVLLALICGLAPTATYNLRFTPSVWFNRDDISHVLLAIVLFLLYLGAREMATPATEDPPQQAAKLALKSGAVSAR